MTFHHAGQRQAEDTELRQVDIAAQRRRTVIAGAGSDIAFEIAGRLLGHDIDRAAQRIAAVERGLRTFQNFDMVDVADIGDIADGLGDIDAVDIETRARVPIGGGVDGNSAADRDVRFGLIARRLNDGDVGREALDAANVGNVARLQGRGAEGGQGNRHVAQLLLAALGGDDDFFKTAGRGGGLVGGGGRLGECWKGECGGDGRSGQESGAQAIGAWQIHSQFFLPSGMEPPRSA